MIYPRLSGFRETPVIRNRTSHFAVLYTIVPNTLPITIQCPVSNLTDSKHTHTYRGIILTVQLFHVIIVHPQVHLQMSLR